MDPAVEDEELLQKIRDKHLKEEVEMKSKAYSISNEWNGPGFSKP